MRWVRTGRRRAHSGGSAKWVGAVLIVLAIIGVAWGQATGVNPTVGSVWTYLGATYGAAWAPPPLAGYGYVPNTTTLGTMVTSLPQVYRAGYYTPGDGGGMMYTHSGAACTLNGGVGDNGWQVRANDGGCWIADFPASGADARDWGVKFDNATDNSATLAAAMAWAALGNHLVLPSASLAAKFATPISVTFASPTASLMITGGGPDQTMLTYTGTSGAGITVNYYPGGKLNHVHVRDFGYCTPYAGGQTALSLVETSAAGSGQIAGSDITNVTFHGCDGYAQTDYWGTAINVAGASYINYVGLRINGAATPAGNGVVITGSSGVYSFAHNFVTVMMNQLATGIQAGLNMQGLTITAGSNFTNNVTALNVTTGSGTDQVIVADSQFECMGNCLVVNTADVFIHHNYFIANANSVNFIVFPAVSRWTVDHNGFLGAGFTNVIGLFIDQDPVPGVIVGNVFTSMAYPATYQVAGNYFDYWSGNTYITMTNGGPLLAAGVKVLSDQNLTFATTTPCSSATNIRTRTQLIVDSNTIAWGDIITGGGINLVNAFCDGTGFWKVTSQ